MPAQHKEYLNLRNKKQSLGEKKPKNIYPKSEGDEGQIKIVAEYPSGPVFNLWEQTWQPGQVAGTHGYGGGMRGVKKPGIPVPVRSRDKS